MSSIRTAATSRRTPLRRRRVPTGLLALCLAAAGGAIAGPPPPAYAANEPVNVWLTSTSDSGGRTVTRGLQQQTPVSFAATSPGAIHTVTVNENTRYQQFEGGGASITDTTAYLLRAVRSARRPGTR